MAPSDDLRAELGRRQSNTVKVREYFREHQGEWVSTDTLERLGGRLAWRTRVANARKVFCIELGWTYPIPDDGPDPIENRQYECGDRIVSEYRYWPFARLGRDASVEASHLWPAFDAPSQKPWGLT